MSHLVLSHAHDLTTSQNGQREQPEVTALTGSPAALRDATREGVAEMGVKEMEDPGSLALRTVPHQHGFNSWHHHALLWNCGEYADLSLG